MNATLPQRPLVQQGGSLWLGFAIGWLVLAGGYGLRWALLVFVGSQHVGINGPIVALVLALAYLPWLAYLGLIIMFAARGKPRTAVGMLIAVASMVGLGLLLVAACFGIMAANH